MIIKDPLVVLDEHVAFSRPLDSWQPSVVRVTARSGALSSMNDPMIFLFINQKHPISSENIGFKILFTVFPAATGAAGPAQDPLWEKDF